MKDFVIGIDIGGTNTAAALVRPDGSIAARRRTDTLADSGFANVVKRIAELVEDMLAENGIAWDSIEGVGIGVPGYLDMPGGIVHFSPNFAGWTEVPLVEEFCRYLPLPTSIVNDVNAHALGEHRFGAGQGSDYLAVLALGTGVGGGLLLDGRLYTGSTGGGGELGHMIIDPDGPRCGCGSFGCLEAFAKIEAITDRAALKLQHGRDSFLNEMTAGNIRLLTPAMIHEAALQGDAVAIEVWDETGAYVGVAAAGIIQAFSPQVIVIGGGISRAGNFLLDPIRRTVATRANIVPADTCRIELSTLGDDAGILGAASLAISHAGPGGAATGTV